MISVGLPSLGGSPSPVITTGCREPPRHPMPGEIDYHRRPVMLNDSLTRSEMPTDIWTIDRKLLETHGCEIEKNEDDGLPQGFFVIAKGRYKRTKGHPAIQFR